MDKFRAMRRLRQQLSEEESISILQKATAGTLALLGDNDYPYAVPISYVYADGRLYFHSALSGHKVDAIRKCDKASFCVIAQDDVQPEKYTTFFRSVIAFGRIHIIENEAEKLATARMLANRYNPNQEEASQKRVGEWLVADANDSPRHRASYGKRGDRTDEAARAESSLLKLCRVATEEDRR